MKQSYIVDRTEEDYVVIEDFNGNSINIHKRDIIGEYHEGDVLVKDNDKFKYSEELTTKRRQEINHMMKDMWK